MRLLPGKKLEVWKHPKLNVSVEIRFDSSDGEFSAFLGDQHFTSKMLEELRKKIKTAVEEATQVNWIPVMTVDHSGSVDQNVHRSGGHGMGYTIQKTEWADEADSGKNNLELNYRRFWVAFVGSRWMSCEDWSAPAEKAKDAPSWDRSFLMRPWYAMEDVKQIVAFPYSRRGTNILASSGRYE